MRGRGSRPPFCQHFSILHYVLVHWGRGRDLMRFNNINRAARSAFPAPTQNEHIHMRKRTFESPERGPGPHADETCGASDPGPSPQCAKTWCTIEHFATKWGPGPIFTSNMLRAYRGGAAAGGAAGGSAAGRPAGRRADRRVGQRADRGGRGGGRTAAGQLVAKQHYSKLGETLPSL